MQTITSRDNPLIKQLVSLMENRKERSKSGLFVAEGLRFCKEAVLSHAQIKTVLLTQDFLDKHRQDADFICDACDDVKLISDTVCKKLGATVSSQGVFCVCEIPKAPERIIGNKFIVLENLQDPGNIGTIIRTAEAFSIDGVILASNCADVYSPKVLRSTMGTVFRIPIYNFSSIEQTADEIKRAGCKIYGTVLDKTSNKLTEINFAKKCAVLIGNEGNGLTDIAKHLCDEFVFIEMSGEAESLNAAVAASIVMWEMQK